MNSLPLKVNLPSLNHDEGKLVIKFSSTLLSSTPTLALMSLVIYDIRISHGKTEFSHETLRLVRFPTASEKLTSSFFFFFCFVEKMHKYINLFGCKLVALTEKAIRLKHIKV